MKLLEGVALSRLCDYSFVEESAQWGNIFTPFMKPKEINLLQGEFVDRICEVRKERDYMTLFIDNIRLYKRDLTGLKPEDKENFSSLISKGTLLEKIGYWKMNFIIFTNLEDTPIDDTIFDIIPDNVLCISAINAASWGGKVIPAPYGLQRQMHPGDNRTQIIEDIIEDEDIEPSNLLYINHSTYTNPKERVGINEIFDGKYWALVDRERVGYDEFLDRIRSHKFMICPIGNALDCHRNWEVLFLRRVPVMKRHPYLEELYKNYPVLFVDKYEDVTEQLLVENEHLFQKAKTFDFTELSLPHFYDKIIQQYAIVNE